MADLTVVTAPTSMLLLDPEEVRVRLEEPMDALPAITRSIKEASSALAGALTFDPWYQEVTEGFDAEEVDCGDRLYLYGRPFVSLVSVGVPDETPLVSGTDFAIRKTGRRGGDAYLVRPRGWSLTWAGEASYAIVARYRMGWWLPGMTGLQPADVEALPADLALAAWLTVQYRYSGDGLDPRIVEMDKGRVRLRLQPTAPMSIPSDADDIVATYRPLILG